MANFSPGQTRSTKGASKQRRDLINMEIEHLKELLPLPDSVRQRLFQLQVMSLICIYIRKEQYLQHILHYMVMNPPLHYPPSQHLPYYSGGGQNFMNTVTPKGIDPCKAMKGFLLVVTRQGKLLYISENATEYLGHSVEEIMSQGDSLYDLVDPRDHSTVQVELLSGPPSLSMHMRFPDERIFICRMNLSRTAKRQLQYQKFVLVEGRYLHHAEQYQALLTMAPPGILVHPVFAAFCQPLITPENAESIAAGNTSTFCSLHQLDMTFVQVDEIALYHLGYKRCELNGTSWYKMVHPANIQEASFKHRLLCDDKEASCILLVRLQTWSGSWIWLHTVLAVREGVMTKESNVEQLILATYQMLTDMEAATLQANSWIYSLPHRYSEQVFQPRTTGDILSDACSQADASLVSNPEEETPVTGKSKRRFSRSSSTGSTKQEPSPATMHAHRGSLGSIQVRPHRNGHGLLPCSRSVTPSTAEHAMNEDNNSLLMAPFPSCALVGGPGPADQICVEIPSVIGSGLSTLHHPQQHTRISTASCQLSSCSQSCSTSHALQPSMVLTPDNSPADSGKSTGSGASGSSRCSNGPLSMSTTVSNLSAGSGSADLPPLTGPHAAYSIVKTEMCEPAGAVANAEFDGAEGKMQQIGAHLPEIEPDSLEAYLRHVESLPVVPQQHSVQGDPLLSSTALSSKKKTSSSPVLKDLVPSSDQDPHIVNRLIPAVKDLVDVDVSHQSCALQGARLARRNSAWQPL